MAPATAKKRKFWDHKHTVVAVNAVRRKEMGLKKAAKLFNIPRSTLKDCVKKDEHNVEEMMVGNLGRKPVLPPELENGLVNSA
jgi:hypothetical protein